jgi:cell division septum initiation protein DivIVA
VSNPRRERHRLDGASYAFLTSIYLFFWSDSAGWRPTRKTQHLCPKEAAAQIILHATGLKVGREAAYNAARKAHKGCVDLNKSLSKPGGKDRLLVHLEKHHTFMVDLQTQVQQDPGLTQLLQENELLEYQLDIIGELRVVNEQLSSQCFQLDYQMEDSERNNERLQAALGSARDAVKDARFALAQVDMDKSLISDGTTLLVRLGKAERELKHFKKYSGHSVALRRVIEVERLLDNVNQNAEQAEQRQQELEFQIEDLTESLSRAQGIARSLRHYRRDKSTQYKELVKTAQSAANYATQCSEELQQLVEHNAEYSMAVGAMWEWCQQEFANKDMALQQMESELGELKKLEAYKGGQYTTKIRVLFYDCLQRGMSAFSARELVKSQLQTLGKEFERLPSLSEIKNYPQAMLFATRIHLARKMHKSILHFRSTATKAWQQHRGNLVEYADGGQRAMQKYHATSFSFINPETGETELLPSRCARVHGGRTSDMNDNTDETLTMLQGMNSSPAIINEFAAVN